MLFACHIEKRDTSSGIPKTSWYVVSCLIDVLGVIDRNIQKLFNKLDYTLGSGAMRRWASLGRRALPFCAGGVAVSFRFYQSSVNECQEPGKKRTWKKKHEEVDLVKHVSTFDE